MRKGAWRGRVKADRKVKREIRRTGWKVPPSLRGAASSQEEGLYHRLRSINRPELP